MTIAEPLFQDVESSSVDEAKLLESEYIARSPQRTAAAVSPSLAFWFLVPGARALISVTSILSEDLQSAAIGLGEVTTLIVAITLGVRTGTLIDSPHKFVPVTRDAFWPGKLKTSLGHVQDGR